MPRIKFLTPLLLLLACAGAATVRDAADPSPSEPIGPAGDVSKLVIHGLDDTLAAQLRTALAERLSLIRIEEPSTPENTFLQTISEAAKQALLADGFPKAAVTALRDKDLAVLDITPGPRYREGDVIVDAPSTVDAAALRIAFTSPTAPSAIHIDQTDAGAVLTLNGFNDLLKDTTAADWTPGSPTPYDQQSLDDVGDTFRSAMRDQGYTQWDAAAHYAADDARHITTLQITIKSVGPKPRLAALTIHGTSINSDAVIRDFLHITADTTVDLPTVRTWFEALAASGRFTSQKLTLQTPAAGAQVTLDLAEQPGVPPLDQSLSTVDQALLRLDDWFGKLAQSGDEIVFRGKSASVPAALSGVFNAQRGISADVLLPDIPFAHNQPLHISLLSDDGALGLALNDQLHFFSPKNIFHGRIDLAIVMLARNFEMGGSVDTARPDVPRPLVVFHTLLLPVGFIELNHDPKWHCALSDGLLTIRNDDTLIRVDAATGRFLDAAPVNPASPDSVTARSATGQLAAATDAFRNRTDLNAYDPASPDAGFLRYLTHSLLQSQLCAGTPAQRRRAAAAIDKIFDRHLLADLFPPDPPSGSDTDDDLTVPPSPEENALTAQKPLAVLFAAFIPRLYPYGSWPWTLCRQMALPPDPVSGELRRLYHDPTLGPLACLAAAELYARSDPAIAHNFASLGLQRLSPKAFDRDAAPLLSIGGEADAARDALANLRDLSDDDFQALLQTLPPPVGTPLIAVRRVLLTHRGQPIAQALPDLLDTLYPLLEPALSAELHRLDAPAPAPPPITISP